MSRRSPRPIPWARTRRRPGVPAARCVAHDPAPSVPILRGPRLRAHAVRFAAVDVENGRGSDYIRVTLAMTAATTDVAKALAHAWQAFRLRRRPEHNQCRRRSPDAKPSRGDPLRSEELNGDGYENATLRSADPLLHRHLPRIAGSRLVSLSMAFSCTDGGSQWPGVARGLFTLAPRLALPVRHLRGIRLGKAMRRRTPSRTCMSMLRTCARRGPTSLCFGVPGQVTLRVNRWVMVAPTPLLAVRRRM